MKGAESPLGPPKQPLKEANRDLRSLQTPRGSPLSHPSATKEHAPAAVRAPSPRQPAPTAASAGHREMLEVQVVAKQLLTEVYRTEVSEDTAFGTLQSYPEIAWLAHCASRCPQPPCWGRYDAQEGTGGQACFINSQTGEASPHPPLLRHFAHLAALALQARQEDKNVKADLHRALEQVRADSELAKTAWDGPHIDTESGAQYWFSADLGCSTWGDPAAAADFLARVISELISLVPKPRENKPQVESKSPREREPTPREKEEQEKEDALVTLAQEIRELQSGSKDVAPEPEIKIQRPEGPLRDPTPPPRVVHRRNGSLPRSGSVDPCCPSPRTPALIRPESPSIPNRRPSSVEPFFGQMSKAPEMQIFEDAPLRPASPSPRTSRSSSKPRTARVLRLPDGPGGEEDKVRVRIPKTPISARGRGGIRLPSCNEESDKESDKERGCEQHAAEVLRLDDADANEHERCDQHAAEVLRLDNADANEHERGDEHAGTENAFLHNSGAVVDENAAPLSPSIFDVPPSPTLLDISRRSRDCSSPPSPSIIIVDERRNRTPPRNHRHNERPTSSRGSKSRGRSKDRRLTPRSLTPRRTDSS